MFVILYLVIVSYWIYLIDKNGLYLRNPKHADSNHPGMLST